MVIAATVGMVACVVSIATAAWEFAPLVAWDVAALLYALLTWRGMWGLDARQTAREAVREDSTRVGADLVLLVAAVASLIAVGIVIGHAGPGGGVSRWLEVGLSIASVVVSWSVVHTIYTLRYARLYYSGPDGGADFHSESAPCFADFAYLAFTVGMTFQVSDTELNSSAFRRCVLRHALLSYLFGTVIVALTINFVAGLSH